VLPRLPRHAGDRNRTSPFAFTGNKFEFRAVGSSQSVSFPLTALNVIVAEAIADLTQRVRSRLARKRGRRALEAAMHEVLAESIRAHRDIIFNGDGYSEAWHAEAAERGLLNLRTTPEALAQLTADEVVAAFTTAEVMSRKELESRRDIFAEQYVKTINIEAATTENLARTLVLPAALRYLAQLGEAAETIEDLGLDSAGTAETAGEVVAYVNDLRARLTELKAARHAAHEADDEARAMLEGVRPAMSAVRAACDALEGVVPADLWPLPTYREMLFVK
jgi:glutamine synthetase